MKTEDVARAISEITYKTDDPHKYQALFNWNSREVTVSFQRPDTFTGEMSTGYGGTVHIESEWTEGDVIRTVFGLFKNLEEHECREGFRYKGSQVFSPHITADALVEAGRHIQGQEDPDSPESVQSLRTTMQEQSAPLTWYCTGCQQKVDGNPRQCPNCGHTIYRPVWGKNA